MCITEILGAKNLDEEIREYTWRRSSRSCARRKCRRTELVESGLITCRPCVAPVGACKCKPTVVSLVDTTRLAGARSHPSN